MLLTKLKATAWGLLLAASLSVGAVALTYRPAAAQPATAGQPAAAKNSPDRDELEALRLEVEALRLELKATKERVKALEEQAQAQQAQAGQADVNRIWLREDLQQVNPNIRWDVNRLNLLDLKAIYRTDPLNPPAASPEDVQQLAAEVEAAAKKLQEKPDDRQALDELNCAVERLRKAKAPKSDP